MLSMQNVGKYCSMKRLIGITVLWALGLFTSSVYGDSTPIKAQVWEVFGRATYSLPGGPPRLLKVGTDLPYGAVIKTGEGAAVEMHFGKTAMVRLTQNSVLALDKMESATAAEGKTIDVEVTLSQGAMVGNLKKLFPDSKFEVKIVTGMVSVREGQFRIHSEGYLVLLGGNMLFAYVPTTGEPALFTLTGPPAVYYSPTEQGVRPAPPELAREVQSQVQAPLRRR
jgi:hypothetical protein